MEKNIRMTTSQVKRVTRLIESECCNCVDGICIVLDHGYGCYCPQMGMRILFCPWLREAVLPADEKMRHDLIGDIRMKLCEMCRREFSPKSNRAMFCPVCAQKNKKMKQAEWVRNKRHSCRCLEGTKAASRAGFRTSK